MDLNLFFYLFNNFIGGADDDYLSENYSNLDLNNEDSKMIFIQSILKPFFESKFSTNQKKELLLFLDDVSSEKIKIKEYDFENQLFPFETPNDIQDFCNSIKRVLYPD